MLAALTASCLMLSSCGVTTHAVVGVTQPISPSTQPQIYGVVLSAASTDPCSNSGNASILDVAGDAILPVLGVAPNPVFATENIAGLRAFSISQYQSQCGSPSSQLDGAISAFTLNTSSTTVQSVVSTTLPAGSAPGNGYFNGGVLFLSEPGRADVGVNGAISVLGINATTGGPAEIEALPPASPVLNFAGITGNYRTYAIEPAAGVVQSVDAAGTTTTPSFSVTATIAVGTDSTLR